MGEAVLAKAPLWQRLQRDKLYYGLLALIFAVGFFVRLYGIGALNTGINQDEASIGYEAFAVANYGIDRNGVSYPAYLIAWGSGQNAGYMWLLIPFIKLFGLSLTTLRLPMALAGCASLIALYTMLRRHGDKRLVLVGTFIMAICPWHILKSRWALESNLLPEFLLWGIALFCAGMATGKKRYYYIGCAVFGLSAWCYATSFLVLPLLLIPAAIIVWRKKYLSLPHLLGCIGVFVLAALPIILFALITLFGLPGIYTPFFSIPAMPYDRVNEFALLADDTIASLRFNAKMFVSMLISQEDGYMWNAVSGFGLYYLVSLPFILVGFLRSVLQQKWGGRYRDIVPGAWMFSLLAAAGLVAGMMLTYPNINRVNALWMPLLWYWILGVYDIVCVSRLWRWAVSLVYVGYFVLYLNTLFGTNMAALSSVGETGLLEAARYADTLDVETIQVRSAPQAYIRVLFAIQMPPEEFRASVTREHPGAYGTVSAFGKWELNGQIDTGLDEPYAIIVRDADLAADWPEVDWEWEEFGHYKVAWPAGQNEG